MFFFGQANRIAYPIGGGGIGRRRGHKIANDGYTFMLKSKSHFSLSYSTNQVELLHGAVAELADAEDLKSSDGDILWVQVPPAPFVLNYVTHSYRQPPLQDDLLLEKWEYLTIEGSTNKASGFNLS